MTLLQEVEAHLIMSKNALREYETTAASNAGAVLQEINDALRVLETYKVMEGVHPTIDSEPVSKPLVFRSADKRLQRSNASNANAGRCQPICKGSRG